MERCALTYNSVTTLSPNKKGGRTCSGENKNLMGFWPFPTLMMTRVVHIGKICFVSDMVTKLIISFHYIHYVRMIHFQNLFRFKIYISEDGYIHSILFYSILFFFSLFYILFYFFSILFCFILFYSVLFCSIL